MSLPLVFQEGVREDLDSVYRWYENQGRGLGEGFLAAVEVVLERIERNPDLQAMIFQDVRRSRLKRFPHAIYYRVEPERIMVIAVHHPSREPKVWQSRIDM